jgi:hypothetical protein
MTTRSEFAQCGNGHTVFWMPALRPDDEPYDAGKFPPHVVESLKARRDLWESQYLLKRPGEHDSIFDEEQIIASMYEWVDPSRTVIRYLGFEFDPDKLDEHGYTVQQKVSCTVPLAHCRFYLHVDAKHRLQSQQRAAGKGGQRPSEAACLVVAVAPDHHVFPVDFYAGDAGLEKLVSQMLTLYCRWAPHRVTWEAIGAQFWLKEYVEKMERLDQRYRHPRARTRYGLDSELPSMSSRMVEGEKTNQSKEFVARAVLSGYVNSGVLHLEKKRGDEGKLYRQLLNVLDEREPIDLVDCLGQGPFVWKAPPPPDAIEEVMRRRAFVTAFAQPRTGFIRGGNHPAGGAKRTGFTRPWR